MIDLRNIFCYRITHISNLEHLLNVGLCNKYHKLADPQYFSIGNPSIIETREHTQVRINGYGVIGEYVPFYFTPRSMMLFNIVTGYYAPVIPKIDKDRIIVVKCRVEDLARCDKFFFTDGQANDSATNHYNDLRELNKVDWDIIRNSNFSKSDGDFDRPRRYQAEFLVHQHVRVSLIDSIVVYTDLTAEAIRNAIDFRHLNINVVTNKNYFF